MKRYEFHAMFLALEAVLNCPDKEYALSEAKKIIHRVVIETESE